MLPNLSALRLPPASVGAPLAEKDMSVVRTDADHRHAMAILAYSNRWDRFINWHVKGKNYLKEFPARNAFGMTKAMNYVSVVAFFAPLADLQRILDAHSFGESGIRLKILPWDSGAPRSAQAGCMLRLNAANAAGEDISSDMSARILDEIILPAGKGVASARRTWNAVVGALVAELKAVQKAWEPRTEPLFHGLNISKGSTLGKTMEEGLQGFVSASDEKVTAEVFSTFGDGKPRVFTFEVAQGTPVIHVDDVLPETWQCAVEKETIIGPGAVFVLKDDENSIISVSPSNQLPSHLVNEGP